MTALVILSVLLLMIILFTVVRVNRLGRHISISQHAAKKSWTYWIFSTSLSILGGIFLFFLQTSFFTTLKIPEIFSIVVPVGWICLLITAWTPDSGKGRLSTIHRVAAFGIAFIMTIIMSSLVFAEHISLIFRLIAAVTTLWYVYTLYLFFFIKNSRRYFLIYQTINIISFFFIILIVALVQ